MPTIDANDPYAPPSPTAIVVGAGYPGVLAAVDLARSGYEVTLLERADRIAPHWLDAPPHSWAVPPALAGPTMRLVRERTTSATTSGRAVSQALAELLSSIPRPVDLRLRVEAVSAAFDSSSSTWTVTDADGGRLDADVLFVTRDVLSSTHAALRRQLAQYTGDICPLGEAAEEVTGGEVVVADTSGWAWNRATELAGTSIVHLVGPQLGRPEVLATQSERLRALTGALSRTTTLLERSRLLEARLALSPQTIAVSQDAAVDAVPSALTSASGLELTTRTGRTLTADRVVVPAGYDARLVLSVDGEEVDPTGTGLMSPAAPNLFVLNSWAATDAHGLAVPIWESEAMACRRLVRRLEIGRQTLVRALPEKTEPHFERAGERLDWLDGLSVADVQLGSHSAA